MNVDTVCTEAELTSFLAGQLTGQGALLPKGWTDATQARTQALEDILETLRRRTPPILPADLADVSQLKRAVKYGAEMWLLWYAMTTAGPDSIFAFRYTEARKRFLAETSGLMPTLQGGARAPGGDTFSWSRR